MWETEYRMTTEVDIDKLWETFINYVSGQLSLDEGDIFRPKSEIALGTKIAITPQGQDTFLATVIEYEPKRVYADETEFNGLLLIFRHFFEPVEHGLYRIIFSLRIEGEMSDDMGPVIGPQISADFPDHLKALIAAAQK